MTFFKDNLIFLLLFICFIFYFQGIYKLPVFDRDEARFATASKTMLETKDLVDIKMQEEPRYKKPIGIYWLQFISNSIFGEKPFDKIWVYRLVSIISILVSLYLIFRFSEKLFSTKESYLSIYFLVFSFLTISEVHQAKTDATLFLAVILCNFTILDEINKKSLSTKNNLTFWISLGVGVLIKGPIIFLFTLLPLLFFMIVKKKKISFIWSNLGFSIFLLIVIPWFILITLKSDGLFWHESVGHDLFQKIKSGQESHGFPPGYYLLLLFILLWPGSIFLPYLFKSFFYNWKQNYFKDNVNFFLFLWFFVPFVIFEIIPTKLPHYIFPSYAPLCILISNVILNNKFLSKLSWKASIVPLIFFPLIICGIITLSVFEYSQPDSYLWVILIIMIFTIAFMVSFLFKKKILAILFFAGIFQIQTYLSAVYYLEKKLEPLWISEKINSEIDKNLAKYDKIFHFGFNEPSLIFLTSHKATKLNIKDFTKDLKQAKILYIVTEDYVHEITKTENFNDLKLIKKFDGFNYSQGRKIKVSFFGN